MSEIVVGAVVVSLIVLVVIFVGLPVVLIVFMVGSKWLDFVDDKLQLMKRFGWK